MLILLSCPFAMNCASISQAAVLVMVSVLHKTPCFPPWQLQHLQEYVLISPIMIVMQVFEGTVIFSDIYQLLIY